MRAVFSIALCLSLFLPNLSDAKTDMSEESSRDSFALVLEYDSDFLFLASAAWTHSFSEQHGISAAFLLDAPDQTLALFVNWIFSLGNVKLQPGVATSFGPASWASSPTNRQVYLFRELGPAFEASYSDDLFLFTTFNALFIPVQESQSTALWLGLSRVFGAIKIDNYGVGPRVELIYSKPGNASFEIDEVRIGGSIFAAFGKSSMELFLGYNPVSVPSFLGVPIVAGPVFRFGFTQAF